MNIFFCPDLFYFLEADDRRLIFLVQTTFDAPTGSNPVAINLASMGKGEAWINGESIGRYWVSFKTPKGQPSQTLYTAKFFLF